VNLHFVRVQRRRGRAAGASVFRRDALDSMLCGGYEANVKAASCRGRAEGPDNLSGEIYGLEVV
jgi:hypothetical protein